VFVEVPVVSESGLNEGIGHELSVKILIVKGPGGNVLGHECAMETPAVHHLGSGDDVEDRQPA
jgi:hypothetical protein